MKTALKVVGGILLLLVIGLAVAWFAFLRPTPPPISTADRAAVTLLPLPAALKLRQGVFPLTGDLSHEFAGVSTPRLDRALRRFYAGLTSATGVEFRGGTDRRLILECAARSGRYPSLGDDESYSLEITGSRVRLKAPGETGIIYGLETLRQLVTREDGHWVLPRRHVAGRSPVCLARTHDRCVQTLDSQGGDPSESGCHGRREDECSALALERLSGIPG